MCQNATATAASLMKAIEPTLISLLSLEGLLNTPDGEAAIAAYNAALSAVETWVPGTTSVVVLELVTAFQKVFNTLPLPPNVVLLGNIILAGVEAVMGIINANSPAPVPTPASATASPEEVQVHWQHTVVANTTANVAQLVPGFKRSIWHSAASQYKSTWNKHVDAGGFPPAMKV